MVLYRVFTGAKRAKRMVEFYRVKFVKHPLYFLADFAPSTFSN